MHSLNSIQNAKDIYYFQPKHIIHNCQHPIIVPKLNIRSIQGEESVYSENSNLNKAFELTLKSPNDNINQGR